MQYLNRVPEVSLEEVGRQLSNWRQEYRAPTPIPEELWEQAAILAEQQGVGVVARALKLDRSRLLKRMVKPANTQATVAETGFLEFLAPPSNSIGEVCLEFQCSSGARLRLDMKSVPVAGLSAIVEQLTR